jgi:hypothetical protein
MAASRTVTAPGSCPCAVFTVIPEDWSVPLGTLYLVDPPRLFAAFRQHLYRSAMALGVGLEGQLFVALHGAYDPATKTFPLHLHGMARGGMIPIVDGLRKLRKYRPAQQGDGRDAANTPVHITVGPLWNMPDPLTYLLKRYWPQRETYLDKTGVRKSYGGKKKGIRGPAYTEHLQFLHRWRLEDITMLMGMSASKQGIVIR